MVLDTILLVPDKATQADGMELDVVVTMAVAVEVMGEATLAEAIVTSASPLVVDTSSGSSSSSGPERVNDCRVFILSISTLLEVEQIVTDSTGVISSISINFTLVNPFDIR